ncbi:MAG: hypothetical protein J7501_11790 [Bdellovibrio sp.]|nr:hypothetical protein [Bdellovibrio sp.]
MIFSFQNFTAVQSPNQNSILLWPYFRAASAFNSKWEHLPKNERTCKDTRYLKGCAFPVQSSGYFQNGEWYSADSLMILPPNNPNDFAKVFLEPDATPFSKNQQWNLNATYGFQQSQSANTKGVRVEIVASGDRMDASEAENPWAVLDSFTVLPGQTVVRWTPMGLWPLRAGFVVAIQVTALGENNWYDNLIVSSPKMVPVIPRPELGIAQSNLTWDENYSSTVEEISLLKTRGLRTNARSSGELNKFVAVVKKANNSGLNVVVNINQEAEDYDNASLSTAHAGNAFRKQCGWANGQLRFSQINPQKFAKRFEAYLKSLSEAKASVSAFEIGNELDWVCFNGDIPLGTSITSARGFDLKAFTTKYSQIIAISRTLIDKYYPKSKLLSFGMANCFLFTDKSCVLDSYNMVASLKSQNSNGKNVLNMIDGIGEHFYTETNQIWKARQTLIDHSAKLGISKPYWITEWGYKDQEHSDRSQAFLTFLEYMNSSYNIPVSHLFLYNYNKENEWSLRKDNGSLDPAARVIGKYNSLLGRVR